MSKTILIRIILVVALFSVFIACRPTAGVSAITYEESMDAFPNPERGFHHARELPRPQNFDIRNENITLIYGRISADKFRDRPFSEEFLQDIQKGFDLARENGIKVNPRVAYNHGHHEGAKAVYGDDAPIDIVMTHIKQMGPLWRKNKDVINHVEAGFIGGWGEWHSSANGLDSIHYKKQILFGILDEVPKDRMVVIRTPHYKRHIFTGNPLFGDSVLTRERAFDGSNLARVGHLNDCFLASENDVGTYPYGEDGWTLGEELNFIEAESRYVPFGGETCGIHERAGCENAVKEMEKVHINWINRDYHRGVIKGWQEGGCYDEIERRLGYRFVLRNSLIQSSVKAGQPLNFMFALANVGFGELFNPRRVEMVLTNLESGEELVTELPDDPRFWGAGSEVEVKSTIPIPENLAPGKYSLGIRMPDLSPSIHDDVRYAIRFANKDVWNAEKGVNILIPALTVN
ncbi:MAG: DUF4832 domain-containing protein [Candidatus Marinimicrobia bacterium]|nr:DUF4832 domain-containing protein [Candidatus Neomarinimicrobiota bacterium]MCF7921854.1 DUF4832 domain-containing protein [Candidatus Neomarinimicrobiota bacterium]